MFLFFIITKINVNIIISFIIYLINKIFSFDDFLICQSCKFREASAARRRFPQTGGFECVGSLIRRMIGWISIRPPSSILDFAVIFAVIVKISPLAANQI